MSRSNSDKYEQSVQYYKNGIEPSIEIYPYAEFTNLLRAKIRYSVTVLKRKQKADKRHMKEVQKLMERLSHFNELLKKY